MENNETDIKEDLKVTEGITQSEESNWANNRKLSLFVVGTGFLVIVLTVFGLRMLRQKIQQDLKEDSQPVLQQQQSTSDNWNDSYSTHREWKLVKEDSSGNTAVRAILCDSCKTSAVVWKNWFIYPEYPQNSIVIKAFDLDNDKEVVLYNLDEDKTFKVGDRSPREISDMKVVGDTFYFSLGGYLTNGAIYSVDLPPVGAPELIKKGANQRIVEWHGKYWIVGGEGDACWAESSYSLIDVDTNKIKEIGDIKSGCESGESLLGLDSQDHMLIARYTGAVGDPSGALTNNSVYSISLSNPASKIEVISKDRMPANISNLWFLSDPDRIVLKGESSYMYYLSDGRLEAIDGDLLETKNDSMFVSDEQNVKKLDLPDGYDLVGE